MAIEFQDAVVGGVTLVREAIESAGFGLSTDGTVAGWRIGADGSATFTDVTIGSAEYTINDAGGAAFQTLDVAGVATIGGVDVVAAIENAPDGIQAFADSSAWTVDSASISTTQTILAECATGPWTAGRVYLVTWDLSILGTVVGDIFNLDIRYTVDGTAPLGSSAILNGAYQNVRINSTTATGGERVQMRTYYTPSADYDLVRFAITLDRVSGTGTAKALNTDANYAQQVAVIDLGWQVDAAVAARLSQKSKSAGVPDPDPKSTYTRTWSATWSRSWDDGGASVYDTNGMLAQGYYSGYGNRISWIGFDHADIQSKLSGATVKKVEVYLYFSHWYSMAGGTAVIGTHNSTATSAPAYDGSKDDQDRKRVGGWGRDVGKWVDITSVVGSEFKTGASTGIVIGQGPSTSSTYYGKADGNTMTHEPKIRITYEK